MGLEGIVGVVEVSEHVSEVGRVLASRAIEDGAEVDGVDGIDYLGNECLFGGLAESKNVVRSAPHIFVGLDLRASASGRRGVGAWVDWCYPRGGVGQGGVLLV